MVKNSLINKAMEEKKLTVDQVKQAANQQISMLYQQLENANMTNTFKRLDYLFEIVKGDFPDKMKVKAISLINEIVLTEPEKESDKVEEEK